MKFEEAFRKLYHDAKEKYNIQKAPRLILRRDKKNAKKILLLYELL